MLSQLSADYFARSPVLALPVFALVTFLSVFVFVSLRALLAKRDDLQRVAELPLADSEVKRHG